MFSLHRHAVRAGAGLAALGTLIATTVPLAGSAVAAPARSASARTTAAHVPAAGGWLATQFVDGTHLPHPDGNHFDQKYGSTYYPDYGLNADVIFGLAAAHVGSAKIATALNYLRRHVDDYAAVTKRGTAGPYDGSVAKLAVAAIAAGANPRKFGGYNLVHRLRADECTSSSSSCAASGAAKNIFSSISESFTLIAEARAGVHPTSRALHYFASLQCASGGFTVGTSACGSGKADVDATSYAIMAMDAAGALPARRHHAAAWLHARQKPGGYWVTQKIRNVDSTGLAAAALAGKTGGVTKARTWLRSQQVGPGRPGAGAFRYAGHVTATTTSATSPSVLATAQALTGLGGNGNLARVSAARAVRSAPVFRPRAAVRHPRAHRGTSVLVRALGFAAGERVRMRFDGRPHVYGHARANSLGVASARVHVPASLRPGRHRVVVNGVASKLRASHRIRIVR